MSKARRHDAPPPLAARHAPLKRPPSEAYDLARRHPKLSLAAATYRLAVQRQAPTSRSHRALEEAVREAVSTAAVYRDAKGDMQDKAVKRIMTAFESGTGSTTSAAAEAQLIDAFESKLKT